MAADEIPAAVEPEADLVELQHDLPDHRPEVETVRRQFRTAGLGLKSRVPAPSSSALMCWVTADWLMPSASAAGKTAVHRHRVEGPQLRQVHGKSVL